jgi:hypothetical protein
MRPEWRKSSFSGHQGDCVEVAFVGPVTAVRDSKSPVATLSLPFDHWRTFLAGTVTAGQAAG